MDNHRFGSRTGSTVACAATSLAMLALSAPAAAESTPAPRLDAAAKNTPKTAITPSRTLNPAVARAPKPTVDCMATDIDSKEGTWNSSIKITGGNIDASCALDYKPEFGTTIVPLTATFTPAKAGEAASITTTIPSYTHFGGGRIRIYPKSSPPSPQSSSPDPGWAFMYSIKTPAPNALSECEVFTAEPMEVAPSGDVILWGNNLSNSCSVVFVPLPPNFPDTYTATGVLLGGNPVYLDVNRIKVVVPMMPPGVAIVKANRRGMQTNKSMATMVIKNTAPVLTGLDVASAYPGKPVALIGKAFLPPIAEPPFVHQSHEDLRVRLQYPGQVLDIVPEHLPSPPNPAGLPSALQVNLLRIVLPNPLPGLKYSESTKNGVAGTIRVYRRDPSFASAPLAFTFKPTPPGPSFPTSTGDSCPAQGWVGCGTADANGSCITMQCCPTQGVGGQCNPTKFGNACCKPF